MFKRLIAPLATSLALLAVSAPAQAGVFVTSVKVSNAIGEWLQVAELQAFSGATNVALAGTATATSVYLPLQPTYIPDASKANDGFTDGDFFGPNGIYHSNSPSGAEFLLVTFDQAYDLSSLTIFGRTDNGGGARDVYNYQLFNEAVVVGSGTLNATAGPATVALPEPATWAMMLLGFGMIGFGLRRRARHMIKAAFA